MEQRKYSQKPSIPAVEAPRPLEVETSPAQQEPTSPVPLELEDDDNGDDPIMVDQNGLRVMQDEGGNGASPSEVTETVLPAERPKQK